mgnify:CR=1 FL=1
MRLLALCFVVGALVRSRKAGLSFERIESSLDVVGVVGGDVGGCADHVGGGDQRELVAAGQDRAGRGVVGVPLGPVGVPRGGAADPGDGLGVVGAGRAQDRVERDLPVVRG